MGRRPIPIEELKRRGRKHLTKKEQRQRTEAEEKLRPPADDIKCPSWLGKAGKREWRRITKSLKGSELVSNVDVASLAVYCDAVDKYAEAAKAVREQGVVIRTGVERRVLDDGTVVEINAGKLVQNPNVLVATKYAGIIARYAAKFGFDPSARAGLAIPKKDDDKPKDRFGELYGM